MLATKDLKCGGCGHLWRGLWDTHGEGRGGDLRCPKCGSGIVRLVTQKIEPPKTAPRMDSANYFEVMVVGEMVYFHCPWQEDHTVMPRGQALNLAAWLALMADPTGKEFERIGKEIQNT